MNRFRMYAAFVLLGLFVIAGIGLVDAVQSVPYSAAHLSRPLANEPWWIERQLDNLIEWVGSGVDWAYGKIFGGTYQPNLPQTPPPGNQGPCPCG